MSTNIDSLKAFKTNISRYKFVNHRLGYKMTGLPENSLSNLETIFSSDLLLYSDGFEFDICFTKDSVPVVIHDKSIDVLSSGVGLVRKLTYAELKQFEFGYRKSTYNSNIPWDSNNNFRIYTLEEFLRFFHEMRSLLGDKIIKIETKPIFVTKADFEALDRVLNRYPSLNDNLVHLSFFPWHLRAFRKMRKGIKLIRTDLLAEVSIELSLLKSISYIDSFSLGLPEEIKTTDTFGIRGKAKAALMLDKFLVSHRGAATEDNIRYLIEQFGSASIYTINAYENVGEFCSRVSARFIEDHADKLVFTTDNPMGFFSSDFVYKLK